MSKQNTLELNDTVEPKRSGPVTCLGLTFESDEARRAHFAEELRKKLQDPAFRKIEGFPLGSDEDILNLSDPPYYTACPNPWIADFIAEWEAEKEKLRVDGLRVTGSDNQLATLATLNSQPETHYHREPFAADVTEGKNDPIYNAHSYHTKVPHKAIMRYILHYTQPGDIVFDGFCGTGMTGVAAQMCGDREVVMSLGYQVKPDGTILQEETDEDGKKVWRLFSKLGVRRAILNDLSPAATFVAYNYNTLVNVVAFEKEAERILKEVADECGWMYETLHTDGKTKGKINYTVWSDVFVCPDCAGEVVFWDEAVDVDNGKVRGSFPCPHCNAKLTKRNMDRAFLSRFDHALQETIRQVKQVPVLINYTAAGKRFEKKPGPADVELAQRIQDAKIPYRIPSERLMPGQETRRNDPIGITHVHHFYTDRNLFVFAAFFDRAPIWLKWAVTGSIQRGSKQHQIAITRVGGSKAKEGGATAGHRRGTLYVPSNQIEMNAITLISDRVKVIKKALFAKQTDRTVIATGSLSVRINVVCPCYDS